MDLKGVKAMSEKYRVEIKIKGKWRVLYETFLRSDAEEMREFMLLGAPGPQHVRITIKD